MADEAVTEWGSWMQRLLAWQRDAAIGDNGEKPTIEIEFDGRWWEVSARSFDDGYADGRSNVGLEEAARETVERLTTHPERQREQEIEQAAWAMARISGAGFGKDRARKIIEDAMERGAALKGSN